MAPFDFKAAARLKKARKMAKAEKMCQNASLDRQAIKVQGRPRSEPKLPSVAVLRKKLESIIHFGVKIRDKRLNNGLCLTCNAEPIYSANHIIPAGESLNTRYDPDNIYGGGIK